MCAYTYSLCVYLSILTTLENAYTLTYTANSSQTHSHKHISLYVHAPENHENAKFMNRTLLNNLTQAARQTGKTSV